ncbi:recombinase family protein [Microbacterium sp. JB110]|uniref:recombinase family protein n=1 Tax=Microbacterium sp. JB110 TaxID=2024477 RepID=UPI000B3646B1|nr:recombinase family protein [Microbacterium sp. JB110]RCS61231.1 hypothetical protein CIK77_06825 [Microbacterium sp. JB110]
MSTALIYLRISVNRTSEHASIQQQRADCHALAHRLGYTRVLEYVDEAVSAYQDRRRPAYQELLGHLHHVPATVIVWHIDRLYRRPNELEQLLDLLDTRPVRIESARGGSFDLNAHEGRLFARQLVAFANYESAHKGARVARAQHQRAQRGLLHGGAHYGYLDDGRLHSEQGPVLRRIAEDYLTGLSVSAIARDLTGTPAPAGGARWNSTTIASILHSRRLHHHNDIHESRWERVMTPEESALIRAIQIAPRRDATRSSAALLSAIARCGVCGNRLVSATTYRGIRIYRCLPNPTSCRSVRIRQASLDAYVRNAVMVEMRKPVSLTAPRLGPEDVLDRLQNGRENLRHLARQYARAEISRDALLEARKPCIDVLVSASAELTRHLRVRARDMYMSAPFARLSTPRQRTLIDTHVARLEVCPPTTTGDPASRVRMRLHS